MGREDLNELVHFACTSEDINNLAYALTVRDALEEVWLPALRVLLEKLRGSPKRPQIRRCSLAPTASLQPQPPWAKS